MINILLILIISPLLWWVVGRLKFSDKHFTLLYLALVSVIVFVQAILSKNQAEDTTLLDHLFYSLMGGVAITVMMATLILPFWEFIIKIVRNRFGKK